MRVPRTIGASIKRGKDIRVGSDAKRRLRPRHRGVPDAREVEGDEEGQLSWRRGLDDGNVDQKAVFVAG